MAEMTTEYKPVKLRDRKVTSAVKTFFMTGSMF